MIDGGAGYVDPIALIVPASSAADHMVPIWVPAGALKWSRNPADGRDAGGGLEERAGGGLPGFSTDLRLVPSLDLGVIVFINSNRNARPRKRRAGGPARPRAYPCSPRARPRACSAHSVTTPRSALFASSAVIESMSTPTRRPRERLQDDTPARSPTEPAHNGDQKFSMPTVSFDLRHLSRRQLRRRGVWHDFGGAGGFACVLRQTCRRAPRFKPPQVHRPPHSSGRIEVFER